MPSLLKSPAEEIEEIPVKAWFEKDFIANPFTPLMLDKSKLEGNNWSEP